LILALLISYLGDRNQYRIRLFLNVIIQEKIEKILFIEIRTKVADVI